MKKLSLLLILCLNYYLGKAQTPVDLEKLTFNENVTTLLGGKTKKFDKREERSTLPAYYTKDVQGFSYGPVIFKKQGDSYANSVSFICHSLKSKKIAGLKFMIINADDAKKMEQYLQSKYGKPEVIAPEPTKPDHGFLIGNGAAIWRNYKPNLSLVMANAFSMEGNKQLHDITVYIIKNDEKPNAPTEYKSAIDRVAATYQM